MHQTLLIRHGQASARAQDYDVLSPLGAIQARRLGQRLAGERVAADAVFSGPRKRQRDTARHLVDAAREAGLSLPDPIELLGGDEIPLDQILLIYLPRVAHDPVAHAIAMRNFDHPGREIRRVLVGAMESWAAGEVASPSLPTFVEFVARIEAALDEVRRTGAITLFVTSAGPVATALHLAAHDGAATPSDVMRLAMRIENASLTRVVHDGARLAAASVRDVSHLPPDERTLI